jgi:predicted Zn-dependent protease
MYRLWSGLVKHNSCNFFDGTPLGTTKRRMDRNLLPKSRLFCRRWAAIGLLLLAAAAVAAYGVQRQWRAAAALAAAREALDRGDYEHARRAGESAGAAGAGKDAFLLLARIERMDGRADAALPHLARYVELGGEREEAEFEHLLARTQQGNVEQEGRLAALIADEHADAAWIEEALAWGCLRSYRLVEAEHYFDRFLERKPGHVPALFGRGQAAYRLGDERGAMVYYRRALERRPDHREARQALADSLLEAHLPDEATEHYEWLSRRDPEDAAALIGLAKTYVLLGKLEEARGVADAAVRHASGRYQSGEAMYARGKIEADLDHPSEAATWLRRAVDKTPEHREAAFLLAQCLRRLGKDQDAEHWRAHVERIRAWKLRLADVCRRVAERPRDAALRLNVAKVFLEMNNEQEAIRWLESGLREQPEDGPTHLLLAEIHARQGNQTAADYHAQRGHGPR